MTILKLTVYARQPLNMDEVWAGMIASQSSVKGLIHQAQLDVNAPLSYLVAWLWARESGLSDAALRLPSALLMCAAPLIPMAARRTLTRPVRLTWAVLLACWFPGVIFAQEARCYGLLFFLATVSVVAYIQMLRRPTLIRALAWSGLSSLLILTHYFSIVLAACEGVAFLVIHRERALRTWPAALAFAPAFASLATKVVMLSTFARPGGSWIAPLGVASLPQYAEFVLGGPGAPLGLAAWAAVALIVHIRYPANRASATSTGRWDAMSTTVVVHLLSGAICIGLGMTLPILAIRYLTPLVPGILLGMALIALRFSRSWPLAPALLGGGVFGLTLGLGMVALISPPQGGEGFSFEGASQALMQERPSKLVFFWDHAGTRQPNPDQFAQIGGFFFDRAGKSIPIEVANWTPSLDPNRVLLAQASAPNSAILWIYDRTVPGAAAIAHPPMITKLDPRWACRDFGSRDISILACHKLGDRMAPS